MATAQLKGQFDAACALLPEPPSGKNWLDINSQHLEGAVPMNTKLSKEIYDFLRQDDKNVTHKGYILDLKASVHRCADQISGVILKAREIVVDQPNVTKLESWKQPSVPPDPNADIKIPTRQARPRAGVATVSPLQRSLRNTTDLWQNIADFGAGQGGEHDGKVLSNLFIRDVNDWVFNQFDDDKNISTITEKWQALVENYRQDLQKRWVVEREYDYRRIPGEAFRKCGMDSWADLTVSKLRGKSSYFFDITETNYFKYKGNQDWKGPKEAWKSLKEYADSQAVGLEGDNVKFPSEKNNGDVDRWISSLNEQSRASYTGMSPGSAVRWKDKDASGYETSLIQGVHTLNALMRKHDEFNKAVNTAEDRIKALNTLCWQLTSFRRDMNGVMWSLSRLVRAVYDLGGILTKLLSDLQTIQVHLWAGEDAAAAPFFESANKNFDNIKAWLVTTDKPLPDQPFHCANGKTDYRPDENKPIDAYRPPTDRIIQAVSGFEIEPCKQTLGLKNIKNNKKIPYMVADGDTKMYYSQTIWIAFPMFPEYPRCQFGEHPIEANDIVVNPNGVTRLAIGIDLQNFPSDTDTNDLRHAVWIKSFVVKNKSHLDIKLEIEDVRPEAVTIVLTQGPLCSIEKLVVGWLIYSTADSESKRIASWQTKLDRSKFAYRRPVQYDLFGNFATNQDLSMLNIPDPQIGSRFWASPPQEMNWLMAPSVMIGFNRLHFGLDMPLHLRTGVDLRSKTGFAVDVATWESCKLYEVGLTVVAAE